MNHVTYKCLSCGANGFSVRCKSCGGDAEPTDNDSGFFAPVGYTIFSHAQLGHVDPAPLPIGEACELPDDPRAGDTVIMSGSRGQYQAKVVDADAPGLIAIKLKPMGVVHIVPTSEVIQIIRHF